ncbi:BOS complex subunit TMEM147-like [Dama dama]
MALFHFRNCFALAYFRCFTTYKCSGLSESSAFWKCVQAGVAYLFVQLCKMLFLVTFFPTWEGGVCDFTGDLVHHTVASAQVWMITRYDLYHTYRPAVLLLMFLSVYKAFVMETFVHLCSLGS